MSQLGTKDGVDHSIPSVHYSVSQAGCVERSREKGGYQAVIKEICENKVFKAYIRDFRA